jgi:hypothetical protein
VDPPVPLSLALSVAGFLITALLGVVAHLLSKRIGDLESAAKTNGEKLHELELAKVQHEGKLAWLDKNEQETVPREVFDERMRSQDDILRELRSRLGRLSGAAQPAGRVPLGREEPISDAPEPPRMRPPYKTRP